MWDESLKREIKKTMRGRILFDVPMRQYTSLQIGGPADALAFPRDLSDLESLMRMVRDRAIPYLLLGKGTNLLVRDRGIRGLLVSLAQGFRSISVAGDRIRAEAGTLLSEMIGFATEQGLSGLAPLYGIPGTVGGGLAMNAGAWGSEVKERVESITVMNGSGRTGEIARNDLAFDYRNLRLSEGAIIVNGTFLMERQQKDKIRKEIAFYQKKRRETQPLQFPSAGSIFKNPLGASTGKIIEELGLKGKRIGGAEVSTIHGNFIINTGNATANHVLELIHLIQNRAFQEKGILLEPEVRILGE
jgi:UDP-N-acetylmuramate dehydrogenase